MASAYRKARPVMLCVLVLLAGALSSARAADPTRVGPDKGWLVLHGGGVDRNHVATRKFVELAGGPASKIVVIVTPIDLPTLTPDFLAKYEVFWRKDLGAGEVHLMDTRDRAVADTDAFVEPLRHATGVWMDGGHLSNLLSAYLGTRTQREIQAVAERGGVIGGSSAGAMVQGSFLLNVIKSPGGMRISRTGMFLDRDNAVGFGLLRQVLVYPHLDARKAERDVAEVVAHFPELLGIGIDEDTGIVIHQDQFEVIGKGRAIVFDPIQRSQRPLTAAAGVRYDLAARTIAR